MKNIEGLTLGHIKVIKRQYNPNVKILQNNYFLVEVKGKQKLMRYDNIIAFGKVDFDLDSLPNLPIIRKNKSEKTKERVSKGLTPKQAILNKIDNDVELGAIMLCISLDIVNKLYELKRFYPKSYFVPLHHYIEEYLNTGKFKI